MNVSGKIRINKYGWICFFIVVLLLIYMKSESSIDASAVETDMVNLKSLLKAAIYAAERGGKIVKKAREGSLVEGFKGKTKEGANDPITNADVESHCAMYFGLKKTFPALTVISEENPKKTDCNEADMFETIDTPNLHRTINVLHDVFVKNEDVTIWIDPLDATQEFTENLTDYVTTMVCVAVDGVPVIGVINYPFSQHRTFWAWDSKKFSTNFAKLSNVPKHKENPRIIMSRSHQGDVKEFAKSTFGQNTNITAAGGAGYKVMEVALGTADVYIHTTAIKKWDTCAGNAIIKALGGKMTTLKGDLIDYSSNTNVVNSDGLLVGLFYHDYYLSKVKSLGKS